MTNVRIAFEKLDGVILKNMQTGKIKPGYDYCSTHIILVLKCTERSRGRIDWFPMVTGWMLQPVSHIRVWYQGTVLGFPFLLRH